MNRYGRILCSFYFFLHEMPLWCWVLCTVSILCVLLCILFPCRITHSASMGAWLMYDLISIALVMLCQCFSRGFPSKFPCYPCASEELCESKMCFTYMLWGEVWGPHLLSHLIAAARGKRVAEPWPGVPARAAPAGKPWQHWTFFPSFTFKRSLFGLWTKTVLVSVCTVPISLGSAFFWDC